MAEIKVIQAEPQYVLTLNRKEAQVVRDLLSYVGFGQGASSEVMSISRALTDAGINMRINSVSTAGGANCPSLVVQEVD